MQFKQILYAIPAIVLLAACGSKEQTNEQKANNTPIPVTLATATVSGEGAQMEISGQIVAAQTAPISTRIMGYITKMHVNTGDNVRAGQLLFSIQSTDIKAKDGQVAANIIAADAALANARKDLERFKTLRAQNSATDKELENITLQYKAAEAQARAAHQMRSEVNANMAYADVTAPFSGTITQKMMDAGGLASPGMPVLMLESTGVQQVTATVTEDRISYIHPGMRVQITADALNKNIGGTVTEISRSSVTTGGQYLIKITLDKGEGLLSGMYVHVGIQLPAAQNTDKHTIYIPSSSLVRQGALVGVYTVSTGNKALLRWLRIGHSGEDQAEVLSGLTAGERFISHAESRLWNGANVKY